MRGRQLSSYRREEDSCLDSMIVKEEEAKMASGFLLRALEEG